jgi:hypothetical protein
MTYTTAAVRPEIVDLIKATIRESMAPFGYKDAIVRAGEDHDGDPVLFVEVEYDESVLLDEWPPTPNLLFKLNKQLSLAGEDRFAHVRHKFQDKQLLNLRRSRRA